MKKSLFTIFCIFTFPLIGLETALDDAITQCFPGTPKEKINITGLQGGLSQASLYKVELNQKKYVLRILQCLETNNQDDLELFCMIEASKKGLSPQIIYISPDKKAIIMEFVEGKTLTVAQANDPENVVKIAKSLQEVHQITGHEIEGESLLSKAQRCFPGILMEELAPKNEIEHAYKLVEMFSHELSQYKSPKVRMHGDLNARNIFLKGEKVYFIDWAETTMEDLFYDLAYLSLKLSLSKENELLLLQSYLQHSPSHEELIRYGLYKKIHHAFWSLTDLYLANEALKKHPEQQINNKNPLLSWYAYQQSFADCMEPLHAQYFYDLSRLNYRLALQETEN